MGARLKARLVVALLFCMAFMIMQYVLRVIFELNHVILIGMISAGFAAILSPRITTVQKQSGPETHLKWFFSKKIYKV